MVGSPPLLTTAGARISSIRTVEWMLEEWGRWARSGHGLAINYPSIEPYERMRGSMVPSALISDDEATAVDKVVSELIKTHRIEGEALAYYYLVTRNYRDISKQLRTRGIIVDRRRIPDLIKAAKMWADGRIKY